MPVPISETKEAMVEYVRKHQHPKAFAQDPEIYAAAMVFGVRLIVFGYQPKLYDNGRCVRYREQLCIHTYSGVPAVGIVRGHTELPLAAQQMGTLVVAHINHNHFNVVASYDLPQSAVDAATSNQRASHQRAQKRHHVPSDDEFAGIEHQAKRTRTRPDTSRPQRYR